MEDQIEIEWTDNGAGFLMAYGHWNGNAHVSGPIWIAKLYHCGRIHATSFGDSLGSIQVWAKREIESHADECNETCCDDCRTGTGCK